MKQPVDNLMLSNSLRSAVIGFAKTLSNEFGKYNITVNNIAPGYTATERLIHLAEIKASDEFTTVDQIIDKMASSVPLHRIGNVDEIASAVLFLASQAAAYITGVTIQIDGRAVKSLY